MASRRQDTAEQTTRIPLVSPYNTRNLDSTNVTTAESAVVGLGIVGTFVVGETSTAIKDKKFVNCFAEKIQDSKTGTAQYYITKRAGFAELNVPATGELATALKVWSVNDDKVIAAFGSTNSAIYDGTTDLGDITGKATFIEETLISGTPYIVMPSTDNTAWYSTGGAPSEITDTNFPGKASRTITGNFVFMDGFAFIMDTTGRIYNSDENSITAWTADSYRVANMYPDNGIGLARYKNLIVAFGSETIEFFWNSGQNPVGSPLDRYDQGFIHFGCLNQYTYTQLEDTVAWVSASDRSGIGVYILDGVQPKRISTPSIDTQLTSVNTNSVYMSSAKMVGKTFIVVTTSATTFVYVVEDDMWHEWQGTKTLWHHLSGTTAGTRVVYAVSRTDTGGKVFVINPSSLTYADDGSVYTMLIQTNKFDNGTVNKKFLHKLSIVGDTTPTTNTLSVQWSDDDYQTWSTARDIDLTNDSPYVMNCGSFKRRAFKFSNSVNKPVRLEAMELQFRQGIH